MMKPKKALKFPIFFILIILTSCVDTRKSVYFVDQPNAILETSSITPEIVIDKNDLLEISISSPNPNATAIFNLPNTSKGSNPQIPEYLVNSKGNIQLPVVGNINVLGLSEDEAREKIAKTLVDQKLLVNPVVTVRLLNFKVTVLGEVTKPTVVDVRNEKISLLEALGFAGDITIYGKKDNVLIIREQDKRKIFQRVDLNSNQLFNSPFYYLKPNDIVYVEANKNKVASSTRTYQLLPVLLSGLSFTAIILDRLFR